MQNSPNERPTRVKRSPILTLLLRVFLIVLILSSVAVLSYRLMETNRLRAEATRLRLQIDAAKQKVDELQYLNEAPLDRDLLIRIAREHGYVFPDEWIFVNDSESK